MFYLVSIERKLDKTKVGVVFYTQIVRQDLLDLTLTNTSLLTVSAYTLQSHDIKLLNILQM